MITYWKDALSRAMVKTSRQLSLQEVETVFKTAPVFIGRPATLTNQKTIARIRDLTMADRRMTITHITIITGLSD